MTRYGALVRICWFLGLFLRAPLAGAEGLDGLYFGCNYGRSHLQYNNSLYQNQLVGQAVDFGSLNFTTARLQKDNAAWWANVGYMAWPNLGFEAAFLHLGGLNNRLGGTFTPTGGAVQTVSAATALRSSGPALLLVFRLPLTPLFDIDLRAGDYLAKTTYKTALDVTTAMDAKLASSKSSLLAGVGAAYTFGSHCSARLDYLRVSKAGDDDDGKYSANVVTAGVTFTF